MHSRVKGINEIQATRADLEKKENQTALNTSERKNDEVGIRVSTLRSNEICALFRCNRQIQTHAESSEGHLEGKRQIPNTSNSLHPRSCRAGSREADPRSHLRGGLLHEFLRVPPSALTTPRTGRSQTQCAATYVYSDCCCFVEIFRHDPTFDAVRQDCATSPGCKSTPPHKADNQSWRQDRCPTRGTVQSAGGEHLSE